MKPIYLVRGGQRKTGFFVVHDRVFHYKWLATAFKRILEKQGCKDLKVVKFVDSHSGDTE